MKICKKLINEIIENYSCNNSYNRNKTINFSHEEKIKYLHDSAKIRYLHESNINWTAVSRSVYLSEAFIREFQEEINWGYISKYQQLSEEFIKEFKDKVNLGYILVYQKNLSKEFIREFKYKDQYQFNNYSYYGYYYYYVPVVRTRLARTQD